MPIKRFKLAFFILFILLEFGYLESDPLLQKPWIGDSVNEEERSFHQFLKTSKELNQGLLTKDRFGRNYKVNPSLKYQYILDDSYFLNYPVVEDGDLGLSELIALTKERREFDAIFLGKGLGLCKRLKQGNEPNWAREVNQITNSLVNKNRDRNEKLFNETDPYGCYSTQNGEIVRLNMESEDFRYQAVIPVQLKSERLYGRLGRKGISGKVIWKIMRFYGPARDRELGYEENLTLQEQGLLGLPKKRIVFTLGASFDESPKAWQGKPYASLWDEIRALTFPTQREKGFQRIKNGDDYTSSWMETDQLGRTLEMRMKEKYFYKSPLGYFLSISYPVDQEEEATSHWDTIVSSFRSKEY